MESDKSGREAMSSKKTLTRKQARRREIERKEEVR